MSKYGDSIYSKYARIQRLVYSSYRTAREGQLNVNELIEIKKDRFYNHPDFDKLTQFYKGMIRGIEDCLFNQIQMELTEWKLYYVNKTGKILYVDKWQNLPLYISKSGKFNGNHFWIQTPEQIKNKVERKPFGCSPSTGVPYDSPIKVVFNCF